MAYMTQEGYDSLVAQLRRMEQIDRPAASAAIAEARDKGDLSENAEYDAAKEAQAHLETKINELKATIAAAKIIDTSKLRTDIVQILSTVEMKNVKVGAKMKYTIVSESEADLRAGKISSTTPIAQAARDSQYHRLIHSFAVPYSTERKRGTHQTTENPAGNSTSPAGFFCPSLHLYPLLHDRSPKHHLLPIMKGKRERLPRKLKIPTTKHWFIKNKAIYLRTWDNIIPHNLKIKFHSIQKMLP